MSVDSDNVKDYVPLHCLPELKDGNPGLDKSDIILVSQYDEDIIGNYISRQTTVGTLESMLSADFAVDQTAGDIGELCAKCAGLCADVKHVSAAVGLSADGCLKAISAVSSEILADTETKLEGYIKKADGETSYDVADSSYITRIFQDEDARIIRTESCPISELIVEKDKLAPGVIQGTVLNASSFTADQDVSAVEYTTISASYLAVNGKLAESEGSTGPFCVYVNGTMVSRTDDRYAGSDGKARCFEQRLPLAAGTNVKLAYESGVDILSGSEFDFSEFKMDPSDFVGLDKVYVSIPTGRTSSEFALNLAEFDKYGMAVRTQKASGVKLSSGIWNFSTNEYGMAQTASPAAAATRTADGLMSKEDKAKLDGLSGGTDITVAGSLISHAVLTKAGIAGSKTATSGKNIEIPYIEYTATGHVISSGVRTHSIPTASSAEDGLLQKEYANILQNFNSYVKQIINEEKNSFIDSVYPVGSLYMTVGDTDPQQAFGGEWEEFPEGYCLITVNENEPPAYDVEAEPGGYVEAVLPDHQHMLKYLAYSSSATTVSKCKTLSNCVQCPPIVAKASTNVYHELSDSTYSQTTGVINAAAESSGLNKSYAKVSNTGYMAYSGNTSYVRPTGIAVRVWRRIS